MRQSQACGGSLVLKNRATSTGSMKTPCKIWKTTLANKRENHKLVSLEAKKKYCQAKPANDSYPWRKC